MAKDSNFADSLLSDYRNSCKNLDYVSIIEKIYNQNLNFSPGKQAPDFELQDVNGKLVSLSSLKGKVVFMDFWATWCVPCLASMPKTLKLIDKFKDNAEVVFLLINVSDNMENWKNYLKENSLPGINLYANKEQSKIIRDSFNIPGIPRYILIDKDGKFIDAKAGNGDNTVRQIANALKL
nr:TlpA disulfide reductase family protein [Sphingobacterium bovistauri]